MEIKTVGQLINHLASKAGIKNDDVNLVNILSNADISKIPIHSELVTAFDENLLNIEAALDQHPKVRNKYTSEILNPFDTKMAALIEAMGIEDAEKEKLKGIRSSYQRFEAVAAKIQELKIEKNASANNADKQALQAQIDKLQADLKSSKDAVLAAKAEYEQKLTDDRKDFRLRAFVAGKKTTLDTLPEEVRNDTILNIINKKLQEQDAELRFDEKGDLQPYKKDGSKLYGANHTLITLPVFVDSTLAQNKLIQVSQEQPPKQPVNGNHQQQNNGQTIDLTGQSNKTIGTNQTVQDMNLEAIKALEELG